MLCAAALAALPAHASDEGPPAGAGEAPRLEGDYRLQGVREMVAQLLLHPDGRFEYGASYGAVDELVKGTWTLRDGKVVLSADKAPAPSFSRHLNQPPRDADCIRGFDGDPGKPTALVACVATPATGTPWGHIMITAVFSNGKQRSGETGSDGKLGFLARPEPEWRGATVQRLLVGYRRGGVPQAPQAFEVPAGAGTAVIDFEPGNLVRPAFDQATLRVSAWHGVRAEALVLVDEDGADTSGRFVRR